MSRLVGLGLVIALHIALVYALVTALAFRRVDVVRSPIETKIIDETQQPKVEPPPPPPNFAPPPPPFVPPPEIRIATPPPAAAPSTAITAVTNVKPTAPPPPPHEAVIVQPRIDAAHSHDPEYPLVSRRLGEQGSVVLQVMVGVDGKVTEAKIVQSSGFPRLDQAAVDGVKSNYRFHPGTSDGTAQAMWYTFKFTWQLR